MSNTGNKEEKDIKIAEICEQTNQKTEQRYNKSRGVNANGLNRLQPCKSSQRLPNKAAFQD